MYILPSVLTESEAVSHAKTISEILSKHGATISQELDLGKKKLAYPIKKDRYGYYRLVEFTAEAKQLKGLDEGLRLSRELLRHLITFKPLKSEEQVEKERALKERLAARRQREEQQPARPEVVAKAAPISAEELDKKLERILEEEPNL